MCRRVRVQNRMIGDRRARGRVPVTRATKHSQYRKGVVEGKSSAQLLTQLLLLSSGSGGGGGGSRGDCAICGGGGRGASGRGGGGRPVAWQRGCHIVAGAIAAHCCRRHQIGVQQQHSSALAASDNILSDLVQQHAADAGVGGEERAQRACGGMRGRGTARGGREAPGPCALECRLSRGKGPAAAPAGAGWRRRRCEPSGRARGWPHLPGTTA